MVYTGSTITEHIRYEARREGEVIGENRGKQIGAVEGKIANLQALHSEGFLPNDVFQKKLEPLEKQLEELKQSDPD